MALLLLTAGILSGCDQYDDEEEPAPKEMNVPINEEEGELPEDL